MAAASAWSRSAWLACGRWASGFSVAGLITSSPLRPSAPCHLPSMNSSRLEYMTSSLGLLVVISWQWISSFCDRAGGYPSNLRRIDDEIGETAVAGVHAGEHLVDLRQRRDLMFQRRKIQRTGAGHGRHLLALTGGEPDRALQPDAVGHHPERIELQRFQNGADIDRAAAAPQAEQRPHHCARRRTGRQAIDHAVDAMAFGRLPGPHDERIGICRADALRRRIRYRKNINASRRQCLDAIEQPLLAPGAEDFRRTHRQRKLRGVEAELPADAVDQER